MTLSLFGMLTCFESSGISSSGDVYFTHACPVNRNEGMMLRVLIFFSYLTCFQAPKLSLKPWDDLCKNDRIVDAVKMIRFSLGTRIQKRVLRKIESFVSGFAGGCLRPSLCLFPFLGVSWWCMRDLSLIFFELARHVFGMPRHGSGSRVARKAR